MWFAGIIGLGLFLPISSALANMLANMEVYKGGIFMFFVLGIVFVSSLGPHFACVFSAFGF